MRCMLFYGIYCYFIRYTVIFYEVYTSNNNFWQIKICVIYFLCIVIKCYSFLLFTSFNIYYIVIFLCIDLGLQCIKIVHAILWYTCIVRYDNVFFLSEAWICILSLLSMNCFTIFYLFTIIR